MSLKYRDFNNSKYIVLCDNEKKYEDFFLPIGGSWIKFEEDGKIISGYTIPKENSKKMLKILEMITLRENARSRKEQNKYHRAFSDSEEEDDDDDNEEEKKSDYSSEKSLSPKKKSNDNKKKYRRSDPKKYYKSFNNKPVDFKRINRIEDEDDESDEYSSSSYDTSSSDGFPSPATPKRKRNYNIDNLLDTIENLTERINYLERKNGKK